MKFDRKTFFTEYRKAFGPLKQEQVEALEFLLDSFEGSAWKDVRHIAYALSTVKHETADTYKPIKEYRSRVGSKGRANQDRYWLSGYYGRGFVQLTWKRNYQLFGIADAPEKALEPETAFRILTEGMHKGMFTGKKLSDFIKGSTTDYRNARKIINGLDKADLIAGYARSFEKMLTSARDTSAALPKPSEQEGTASIPTEPATSPPKPAEIHVENVENVKVDHTPPPSPEPVTVKVERVSVFSKIAAGFAGLAGLGISLGEVIQGKLSSLEPMHFVYVIGGVALIAVALWAYDKAQARAHAKTIEKMKSAADPASNTVELTRSPNK